MTKGKGYLLPAVINPERRRCIPVYVPDHPDHIRAFLGQLDMLSYWWTWARDEARTAAQVARVWRGVIEQVRETLDAGEGCGGVSDFDVRQNSSQPCRLEKTTNNGVTWTAWADLSLCRPDLPALLTGGEILVPFDGELIPITDLPPGTDTITTSDERRSAGDDEELAKCLAAVNAALVFRRLHQEAWRIQLSGGLVPGNILVAGALAIVGLGLLASNLIIAPAGILTWLLFGNITEFTSEVEREFACILKNRAYINADEVYFDWALVKSDVQSRINLLNIWMFIDGYLDVIGANGLNKAGTVTAITECCDPCADGTAYYDIDLTVSANKDVLVPMAVFTNSSWTWIDGTGWRLASPTNTAQGSCRFTLPINPNSQLVNVFVRMQASHEPYNWSITINNTYQRIQNGYNAFGNFYHGLASPMNIYAGTLGVIFFVNVNPRINTAATFTHLRIEYRGCPPL